MSLRPDIPASQTTTVGTSPWSVRIFTSIDAKPKIAFVGRPSEVAIDSGRAKNARYASEFPSIRNSSRGWSPLLAAMRPATLAQDDLGSARRCQRDRPAARRLGRGVERGGLQRASQLGEHDAQLHQREGGPEAAPDAAAERDPAVGPALRAVAEEALRQEAR